jgi:hypothetical protein
LILAVPVFLPTVTGPYRGTACRERKAVDVNDTAQALDYFRRDEKSGISPPDLSKAVTFAEHIVHARGKRTQYTSVSLDLSKIKDFGDADYQLDQPLTASDGHVLVRHETLLAELQRVIREEDKAERFRAIQALRYATRRKEGLVDWRFTSSTVARKDLISWADRQVQKYFKRI